MISLIYGKKGSGKTKKLIAAANDSIKEQKGDVLFIDDDNRYMFDLRHEVRFINAGEYRIRSASMFAGFICGILAQNFDVSVIFIDAFVKLCGGLVADLEPLFETLQKLGETRDISFVISVSGDPDDIPSFIKDKDIRIETYRA